MPPTVGPQHLTSREATLVTDLSQAGMEDPKIHHSACFGHNFLMGKPGNQCFWGAPDF